MHNMIAFVEAHWLACAIVLAAVLPSLITALSNYPKAKGVIPVLQFALQFLSVLTHRDSPGTLKLPLIPDIDPHAAAPSATAKRIQGGWARGDLFAAFCFVGAVAAIIIGVAVAASGCGPNAASTAKSVGVDVGACALGQVPAAVQSVIPEVEQQIQGLPVDWQAYAEGKLLGYGVDVAVCAVEAVIARLSHSAGDPVALAVAKDRADLFLAAHGVKVAYRPPVEHPTQTPDSVSSMVPMAVW